MFYLHRISSGQVLGVSVNSYGALPSEFAEHSTPTVVDLVTPHVVLSGVLRAATAPEIAGFAAAEQADNLAKAKQSIKDLFDAGGPNSVLIKAVVLTLKDEINLLRTAVGQATRTNAQIRAALRSNVDALT